MKPTFHRVVRATSEHLDVPTAMIRDPRARSRRVTYARHLAQYLVLKHIPLTKQKVAEAFNLSDHTATIYAFNRISSDKKAMADVAAIERKVQCQKS